MKRISIGQTAIFGTIIFLLIATFNNCAGGVSSSGSVTGGTGGSGTSGGTGTGPVMDMKSFLLPYVVGTYAGTCQLNQSSSATTPASISVTSTGATGPAGTIDLTKSNSSVTLSRNYSPPMDDIVAFVGKQSLTSSTLEVDLVQYQSSVTTNSIVLGSRPVSNPSSLVGMTCLNVPSLKLLAIDLVGIIQYLATSSGINLNCNEIIDNSKMNTGKFKYSMSGTTMTIGSASLNITDPKASLSISAPENSNNMIISVNFSNGSAVNMTLTNIGAVKQLQLAVPHYTYMCSL